MKDILYALLGNVEGNTKENLMTPVDKVDSVIHDAIETHADDKSGAILIASFIEVYIPFFSKKEDFSSLERIRLSALKLKKAMLMFN